MSSRIRIDTAMIFSIDMIICDVAFIDLSTGFLLRWKKMRIFIFWQIEIIKKLLSKLKIICSEFITFMFIKILTFKSSTKWDSVFTYAMIFFSWHFPLNYKFNITYSELSWIFESMFLILMLKIITCLIACEIWSATNFRSIRDMNVSLFMQNSCSVLHKISEPRAVAY